jgi:hypothetical protein
MLHRSQARLGYFRRQGEQGVYLGTHGYTVISKWL